MKLSMFQPARTLLVSALLLALPMAASAQQDNTSGRSVSAQVVTPRAQAVLDRMTNYLRSLQTFSISADATRDEVLSEGYKLQHSEHSMLTVQRPNKLRAEISGDLRNRSIVYDGAKLTLYSPDDAAYVRVGATETLAELIGFLLDAGVEMPMIDVLYQGAAGSLTDAVHGGAVAGSVEIDGVMCDHLVFRQSNVDWQIWVQQGEQALPRKIVITTRYEVGDPQFQVNMKWNTQAKTTASTFAFNAPAGAIESPLVDSKSADAQP